MTRFVIYITVAFCLRIFAQSGGVLSSEQSAYDVKYYELNLHINPADKSINGYLLCRAEITDTLNKLVMDLDNPFIVDSVFFTKDGFSDMAEFTHSSGKLNILFPDSAAVGELVEVVIAYSGIPRISFNPPWSSGFIWKNTPAGKPFIGVTCEHQGADIWWPCKDHPSDEPDSMRIILTLPDGYQSISNGRFLGRYDNQDGTASFDWFISTPINNYNVTFYASEYSVIEDSYLSTSGASIPFYFWVFPEYYDIAVNYMDVFKNEFNFLESVFGPFPFGMDKHGFAQAAYYGMEHQTIIAYGNNFRLNSSGFDYIHYHELAHEWWGNFITAKDWSDVWIHEGLATYSEALYVEHLQGKDGYHQYINWNRPGNNNIRPLAPRETVTADEAFNTQNPYYRGAAVLHTLRYHLGDTRFFKLLKEWVYPDTADFDNTNGRLCRILSTDDMKNSAEKITGLDLDPFFEVFFRETIYPSLNVTRQSDRAEFTWVTETNVNLDLDIPILVNGLPQKIDMRKGKGIAFVSSDDIMIIDPEKWILMDEPVIVSNRDDFLISFNFHLDQNYPNPFNPVTTIKYEIPEGQFKVILKVYDILGREIALLVNEVKPAGKYQVKWNAESLPDGVYFCKLQAGNLFETKKMVLLK